MAEGTDMAGFERDAVEAQVQEAIMYATEGEATDILPSRADGVVAFSRLSGDAGMDWDALATVLRESTGIDVVCVADCDWSFDDREDERATLIAFDVPELDPSYGNDPRNRLSARSPRLG